jgi:hypothetical protein
MLDPVLAGIPDSNTLNQKQNNWAILTRELKVSRLFVIIS